MERNTSTHIGALKIGDRFYFLSDRKKVVYQVTAWEPHAKLYNRINAYGYKMLSHDIKANNEKHVIFLRHKNTTIK